MKILLTGVNGQVGWELHRTLATLGEVIAPRRAALDLANAPALREAVRTHRPDLIVNPAAWTAVDRAESEPEAARAINAIAPAILAEESARLGAGMIHFSTDYVFDGSKTGAWREDDATAPLGVYGASKLEGEQAVLAANPASLILRTSWVYSLRGNNFLLTMQRLFRERDHLRIVADQTGAPTWARSIAEATAQIIAQSPFTQGDRNGIYHLTCGGSVSWHGFATAILARTPLADARTVRLEEISTPEYPTPARRPPNSVLDNGKLRTAFGIVMPDWLTALELCLARD